MAKEDRGAGESGTRSSGRKAGGGMEGANADTRMRILESARQLFLDTGYHKVSMRTLAKAAGVSTGPLYFHFSNKAEVYFALSMEALQVLNGRIQQAAALDLPEARKLHMIFMVFEGFYREEPVYNQIIRLAFNPLSGIDFTESQRTALRDRKLQYMNIMKSVAASGIHNGELRDTEATRLMLVLHALGEGIMMAAENGDLDMYGVTVTELVNEASRVAYRGIAVREEGEQE
ncbi:TetR/AcrR family transcriptional regulator [Paenibacillus sp. MMS20-IR301]|uniref:TetR/AcrR family transcriptional regulator n=1 Tax=Paenibacillus sp. MMS20-IR301 TaxID=2895946 RepID=UPI0028F02A9E|nr:TetR/AcrR family transcriptional regulator [Paenibacillus sp. MMS20-IR301]WNS44876.1 TetR/AcrR family transcriptional regulator [Paenibacillus sp. MMS20-IR301]